MRCRLDARPPGHRTDRIEFTDQLQEHRFLPRHISGRGHDPCAEFLGNLFRHRIVVRALLINPRFKINNRHRIPRSPRPISTTETLEAGTDSPLTVHRQSTVRVPKISTA